MEAEAWRWIWLAAAVVFVLGEMAAAGSFFLLPMGIGAAAACVLAFLDVDLAWQFAVFVVVSAVSFGALFPLRRRLDRNLPTEGIGSRRLIAEQGVVLQAIPAGHDSGMVRIGREEWRADSVDGSAIPAGSTVKVVDVKGTRVLVWPLDRPEPRTLEPPPRP